MMWPWTRAWMSEFQGSRVLQIESLICGLGYRVTGAQAGCVVKVPVTSHIRG